jgi:NADH:ubiquinone oxidoreductase subunit 3 (subunit A)
MEYIKVILLNPVTAMLVFTLLAFGILYWGKRIGAKDKSEPNKYLPYTGGENLDAPKGNMRYDAFFRLAIMFVVLHVAGLVISTMPFASGYHWVALFFLFGIFVSVLVLVDVA